ncbi:MAG: protease [Bacteroidota bacterium]|nr:protease [Bacteroidota bacterium]
MYIPKHFEEKDITAIEQHVREFGFAVLVTVRNEQPFAAHIPMELEKTENGEWLLSGHIARANPQWRDFEARPDVMAIFMGPHTYVSPSWYNHKNVPTWNYKAVHLYGKIRIIEDEELKDKLRKIMARYENAHTENPLKFDELPAPLLEKDLNGIVGFEIKVERIEASSKLSQNRDAESHQNVIDHLKEMNAYDAKRIAEEMEKQKPAPKSPEGT